MYLLHPVLGAFALAFTVRTALLGFRGRHRRPYAPEARRAHARGGPVALALVLAAALAGILSAAFLREDLKVATSWHFRVACILTLGMLTQRWMSGRFSRAPRLRPVHAWLGLGTLATGVVLAALGMNLLP